MSEYFFLPQHQVTELLLQKVSLQQWLGVKVLDGFRFILWVEIDADTDEGWNVYEKESLDSGVPGDMDVTSFYNNNDPDSPEGILHHCSSLSSVVEKCSSLGCSMDRFVRFCDIQWQYEEFVGVHGLPERLADEYFSSQ